MGGDRAVDRVQRGPEENVHPVHVDAAHAFESPRTRI